MTNETDEVKPSKNSLGRCFHKDDFYFMMQKVALQGKTLMSYLWLRHTERFCFPTMMPFSALGRFELGGFIWHWNRNRKCSTVVALLSASPSICQAVSGWVGQIVSAFGDSYHIYRACPICIQLFPQKLFNFFSLFPRMFPQLSNQRQRQRHGLTNCVKLLTF